MAKCYSEESPAGLQTPARNNYFYGKMLDVKHFNLEQRYFNDKRWLLNRMMLGSGVMCGLQLVVGKGGGLALMPGVAIDPLGREIIVPGGQTIDITRITDDCGYPTTPVSGGTITICLAYHPCATEMVPVMVSDCESRDGCAPSTILESFAILVSDGAPDALTPGCSITDLFAPPEGESRAQAGDVYARLVETISAACPDPAAAHCVVLGQVTLPGEGEMLTQADVQYVGRQIILNNSMLFDMLLCLWDRVEACCGAPAPSPSPSPSPSASASPSPSPTVTPTPTASPSPSPTASPTPSPTARPSPTPTRTPTPSPAPVDLLKIKGMRIMSDFGNGAEVLFEAREDTRSITGVKSESRPNIVEVDFTQDVIEETVNPETFFVINRQTGNPVPAEVRLVASNVARLRILEPEIFPPSAYIIVLQERIASAVDGRALDGEAGRFPTGNDNEGGNFEIGLRIS